MGLNFHEIYEKTWKIFYNSIQSLENAPNFPIEELEWLFLKTIILIKIQNKIPIILNQSIISIDEFDDELNRNLQIPLLNLTLYPKEKNREKFKYYQINYSQFISNIQSSLDALFQIVKCNENISSADCLGLILEYYHLDQQKNTRQTGIYYTPHAEQKFMIFFALANWISLNVKAKPYAMGDKNSTIEFQSILETLISSEQHSQLDFDSKPLITISKNFSILDPACGNGEFLLSTMNILYKLILHKIVLIVPPTTIFFVGIDLDPKALLITELRFFQQKLSYNSQISQQFQFFSINTDFLLSHRVVHQKITNIINQFNGFDIILGNPPYIRPRDLANPNGDKIGENDKYREELNISIFNLALAPSEIDGHTDYYLYFYYHAINLLAPNGILGFITSNSWLNVRFGYPFQEFLLNNCHILQCIDNTSKSFKSAEINTAILFVSQKTEKKKGELLSQFIRWLIPFQNLLEKNTLLDWNKGEIIEDSQLNLKLIKNGVSRTFTLNQNQIVSGYQWGNYYFLAPLFFFRFMSEIGNSCEYLSKYATVNRGITTNCNDYFILHPISKGKYQNGFGDVVELPSEVLIPLIESPRLFDNPIIEKSQLNSYLFYTDYSKSDLKALGLKNVLDYIAYGESVMIKASKGTIKGKMMQGVISLPSFKTKFQKDPECWYCLKSRLKGKGTINENPIPVHIFFQKIYDTTFKIFYSADERLSNNTFYEIRLKNNCPITPFQLFSILSGSLTTLCLELNGRTNFGGGAIDTATFDIEKIIVPNLKKIDKLQWEQISLIMKTCTNRKMEKFQREITYEDKNMLDTFILKQFTHTIPIEDLYKAIVEIQSIRIRKANT